MGEVRNTYHPMIYLLLGKNSKGQLVGYFSNGRLADFHLFKALSDMLYEVNQLLEIGSYFEEQSCGTSEAYISQMPKLKFRKLFIIEILYRQHGEWQGLIYGITRWPHAPFRDRNEMIQKIMSEIQYPNEMQSLFMKGRM